MPNDPSRSILASALDACDRYERRELTEPELRASLERKCAALRAVEPDAARVLASFVGVIEKVEQTRPAELRWSEICAVIERVRGFARLRDTPVPREAGGTI